MTRGYVRHLWVMIHNAVGEVGEVISERRGGGEGGEQKKNKRQKLSVIKKVNNLRKG